MKKAEFLDWVKNDITISGALTINVPDKEIERIITKETKYLAEIYPDMIQDSYCILHPRIFHSPEFRANRTIQFPDCVKSIVKFEEMLRRGAMLGFNDADLTFNRAFMSDVWFSAPFSMDTITYRMMSMEVWDQMKRFTLVDINYSYNRNTHKCLVLGHDPRTPVFCQMNTIIPEEDAWDDPWVQTWIAAKCRLSVYRLLGTFTANLVGGVTINAATYKETADADIEKCETYFKELIQPTYFLDFA